MKNDLWLYYLLAIGSVLIADISQIILKKAAVKKYSKWYKSYLNFPVISAYGMFFVSTIFSVISLKKLPLSLSPVWQSMGQIFVVVLSYFVLHEKISRTKLHGILIIIIGIILFSFPL